MLLFLRVILPGLAAVLMLGIACQRTFINPNAGTPAPNPTASLPTPLPSSGDRTSLARSEGQVWVLLTNAALDGKTPVDIASARNARMSVAYDPQTQALAVT